MKITKKITLTFLLTSLIFIAWLSTLSYFAAKACLTKQARCHLESAALIQQHRVKQIVAQNSERLRLVSSRTQLRKSLRDFLEDARPEHQSMMNQILDDAKSSIPDLINISVLTLGGQVVASTNREDIGSSYSDKKFFVRGKEENCADIFILDEDQTLRGILSGPLYFENGLLGVVVIECSAHNIISLVSDYTGLGETGETLLAQRDKTGDALFLTSLRFDRNAALRRRLDKNDLSAPITQALKRREDVFNKAIDYRGKSVLAGTRYIPETDWGLVVKIDRAEALAPVEHLRNLLGITIFISSIALIMVSLYITRRITAPVRELIKGAEEIGSGNFGYRTVMTSKDELAFLSQAFNEMAQNLQEITASRDELNKVVTERKRAEEALRQSREELAVRNRIAEIFLSIPHEEMYGEVLRAVLEAMQSNHGIFGYIDEHGRLVIPSMTTDIWEACKVTDKTTVYPPEMWGGIWGRALVEKKSLYANEGLRVPEGHLPIINVLVVPIKYNMEVIGLLEVANKATDYDETDMERLETIANHIAPILNARLKGDWQDKRRERAEKALRMSERELSIKNRIAEVFLTTSDEKTYREVLEVVLEAMQSKFGTFAYINEKGERVVPSMTRGIWDKCEVADKTIVFPRETWGNNLWATCLIEKKAISSNGPFKVPPGHVPIIRALAVPIIHRGEAIGNFMVGNKATDYDETDVELLKSIAGHTAPILHARLQTDRHSRKRGRAEKALRENEEKYRSMMEAMKDPVYICSPDFRIVYMNPVMVERTGYDAAGEPCHKAINDLDEKCPWCVHEKVLRGEHVETEIVSPKDGRFYHVSHSPIVHVDGSISKMTIFTDVTELKKAEEALRKAHKELERRVKERTEELRQLSGKLLHAHEEESRRIGQELHDGLAQTLSAVKVWGEAAVEQMGQQSRVEVLNSLENVVSLTKGAVEDVRRISLNLRPSMLDDLGLLPAISWLCNNFQVTYPGIGIERQIDVQENDMPEHLKIIIFRISQEALNNIGKHSQASLVHLALRRTDGHKIELTITDNGTGFDLDHVRSRTTFARGLGLDGMRERTSLSGGSFSIESTQGKGTTLRALWEC